MDQIQLTLLAVCWSVLILHQSGDNAEKLKMKPSLSKGVNTDIIHNIHGSPTFLLTKLATRTEEAIDYNVIATKNLLQSRMCGRKLPPN